MVTREELRCRLEVLFADESQFEHNLPTYTYKDLLENGVPTDRIFVVEMPRDTLSDQKMSDKETLSLWLDTPNSTFGNECPRSYLETKDQEKLDYLDAVLGGIESGAFS